MKSKRLSSMQWLNIPAYAAMAAVNALAVLLPINGVTPGQVSDAYPTLFAPAAVTFSIWSVIYLLLLFTLYQTGLFTGRAPVRLGPAQRIGPLFALSSLFNIAWIFCWHYDRMLLSLLSMLGLLVTLMLLYAYHALMLGYTNDTVSAFFLKGLREIGNPNTDVQSLLPVVMKVGEVNLKCMALLEKANTETYGTPVPATVSFTVEKGPFIVVTGHDLKDLQLLLEQTEGKGVNIYTHGEMLPAHGYPKPLSELRPGILLTGSREDEFCAGDSLVPFSDLLHKIGHGQKHIFEHGGHPAMMSNAGELHPCAKVFLME